MRQFLTLICFLHFTVGAFSQSKVDNYVSIMNSYPVNDTMLIVHAGFDWNCKCDTVKREFISARSALPKRPKEGTWMYDLWKSEQNDLAAQGELIDKRRLINYKSDTLFVLSIYYQGDTYIGIGNSFEIFKTRKKVFYLTTDLSTLSSARYTSIKYVSAQHYANIPNHYKLDLDTILHAAFSWDIDKMINAYKTSENHGISVSIDRIIINNHQVVNRDVIYINPAIPFS